MSSTVMPWPPAHLLWSFFALACPATGGECPGLTKVRVVSSGVEPGKQVTPTFGAEHVYADAGN